MVVRTAGNNLDATGQKSLAKCLRIFYNTLLIRFKCIGERLFKADCLRSNHMHQWSSLDPRENRLIKIKFLCCFLITENQTAAGSPQGLVRGGRHHVRVRNGAWVQPCRHKSGNMRHIHHQNRADLISHLAELLKINRARISRRARNNHLRLIGKRKLPHLIIIQKTVVIDTIRNNVKIFARHINRTSVRQVPAVVQIHTHNGIPRLTDCKLYRHICLCAGMRLYIGIVTAKKLLCPIYRQILYYVHALAAAVIPLSRISFRILIRQGASHRRHNRLAHPVLGSNQLNVAVLPFLFIYNRLCNFLVHSSYFI